MLLNTSYKLLHDYHHIVCFFLLQNESLNAIILMGGCLDKMVLGIGSYGQTSTLEDPSNTAIGAPVSGPGNDGPYTRNNVSSLCFNVLLYFMIVNSVITNVITNVFKLLFLSLIVDFFKGKVFIQKISMLLSHVQCFEYFVIV